MVWNLQGLPKLRHFMWRFCKGSLATKQVLFNRYCVSSPACDRCSSSPKTILHALCDCSHNEAIWRVFPAASVVRDAPRDSPLDFFSWSRAHTSEETFLLLCTNLWANWFLSNEAVFTSDRCDPVSLVTNFHTLVRDFNQYALKTCVSGFEPILKFQSWCPCAGWVKINFDAHMGVGSYRGLGVVIRDENGQLIAARVRKVCSMWLVDVCEAAAALFGVDLAADLGFRFVHLEGVR